MKLKNIKEEEIENPLNVLLEEDKKRYVNSFKEVPPHDVAYFIKARLCEVVGGDATITTYCYNQFLFFLAGYKARPILSKWSGGYSYKKDVTHALFVMIMSLGVKFVHSNDAPRCGMNGDFFKLS